MRKKQPLNIVLPLVLTAGLLAGCASTPELDALPEIQIDRKLSLPKDVSSWRVFYAQSLDSEPRNFVHPLYWEQGLTERLTLTWAPLPLEFRYLIHDGEAQGWEAGAALLGSFYSRNTSFNWRPLLRSSFQKKISDFFAFRAQGEFQLEVKRAAENNLSRAFGVSVGGLFQIHPRVALKTSIWVINEWGELYARYLGALPLQTTDSSINRIERWRFPLIFEASVQLHRQWEIQARLEVYKLGYDADYLGLPLYLSLIYYW